MRKTHIIVMLVFVVLFVLACRHEKDDATELLPELAQAESVMYEHPDSALHILQRMQIPDSSEKLQKATWALLMTQAKYKNCIGQSDSLVNIAYNYFINKENIRRRVMVLYYKGAICYEHNQIEEAQKWYLEATKEVDQTDDYQLAHLVYIELGNLYLRRSFYKYAHQNFEKALHYAQLADYGRYISNSYINLARVASVQSQVETSIEYYKKAIYHANKIHNLPLQATATNELAGIFQLKHDYKTALTYAQKSLALKQIANIQSTETNFLVLGDIYRDLNIVDSAYFYLEKAVISSNINTKCAAYLLLYYLSRDNKRYKNIALYIENYRVYQDSIYKQNKSRELIEMQSKYDQQKVINEKNRLQIEKDRTIRNILIVLALLCCLLAVIIYTYQRKLLRKERIIQRNEKESQLKALKMQENERTISRNESRMKELEEQMEANKGVQDQLEEQKNVLLEIKSQNEALQQENKVLQQHIDTYSSSLNEKNKELDRLRLLGEENQRLHDRERFLCNQLIKKTDILYRMKTKPQYMKDEQWEEVKDTMNLLFDNYITRLSALIPALTEGDLQIGCFIKLGINNPGIAELLGIEPASVSKRKLRLKERIMQKVGTFGKGQTLDLWLWEF